MTMPPSPDLLDLAEAVAAGTLRADDAERQLRLALGPDHAAESEQAVRELRGLMGAAGAVRAHARATRDAFGSASPHLAATVAPTPASIATLVPGRVTARAVHPRSSNGGYGAGRAPRRTWLLAAAALLLVGGAMAAGSGLVKLPSVPAPTLPVAVASPSPAAETPSPVVSPSTAETPWITGQELMDALSAEYGYQWSPLVVDASTGVQDFESGPVRVSAPVDGRATVRISDAVDAASAVEQHAGRVAQALAPDVAPWIQNAIAQGLGAIAQGLDEGDPLVTKYAGSAQRVSTILTAGGGQVGVTVVDEELMGDWLSVEFTPDAPPTRMLEPGGSGIVLYPVPSGRSGDRMWAANPDGTDAGMFIPSTRTPYGVASVLGWSADGSRLLYGGGGGVFAVDADGSEAFRVGARRDNPLCPVVVPDDDCQANDEYISISPDGTRLAYSLQEGSESDIHTIAVLDVASGQVTRLESTRAPGVDMPSWSPDGTRLVFGCPGAGPRADGICGVNVDGSDLRQILSTIAGDVSDLQWSPDGSSILFKVDGGGRAELFTIGPDGANLRSLTSDGLPDHAYWTRDGRIVFIRREQGPAGGPTDRGDLRIMDADGGNPATIDTTIPAQTAAGCLVCPYPDEQGRYESADHEIRYRLWQPMPEGQP